jgi:hypothetical protein
MMKNLQTHKRAAIGIIGALLLSACGNSSSILPIIEPPAPPPPPPPAMVGFQATVTDITNGQPFSPAAIIVHQAGYSVFTIGSPATVGLDYLAEGGDNAELIAEAVVENKASFRVMERLGFEYWKNSQDHNYETKVYRFTRENYLISS